MLGDLGMRMFDRNIYYLRKAEKVDYYAFALLHLNIILIQFESYVTLIIY